MTVDTSTQVAAIGAALDALQKQHNVDSDRELAQIYELSPKTVSFMRNGKWTRTDRLLISALLAACDCSSVIEKVAA